jgi:hypothetical protein
MALASATQPVSAAGFTEATQQFTKLSEAGLMIRSREGAKPLAEFIGADLVSVASAPNYVDLGVHGGVIEGKAYCTTEPSIRTVERSFGAGRAGVKRAVEWATQMAGSMGIIDIDATLAGNPNLDTTLRGGQLLEIALTAATELAPERVFAQTKSQLLQLDEAVLFIHTVTGGYEPLREYIYSSSACITDGSSHVDLFARGAAIEGRAYGNDLSSAVQQSFELGQLGAEVAAELAVDWAVQMSAEMGLVHVPATERAIAHEQVLS